MPADREIQLKFSADTNQVNAALDNTKRKAKETAREVNNVPKPRKSAKATSEPTGDDAKLQQNAAALRKEIEALSASYAALTAQTSKFADSLKKSLANLDANTAAYEKNRAALETTLAKVDTLYNSLNNGTASLQRYTKALEKLSKEAKKVSLAKATAEVDKMSKALLTQQKNFTALEQRANQFAATWATKQAKANERVNAAVEKRVQVEKTASTQSEAAEKRAAAAQQKTQRQIQLTKLSYEELIQELIKYQTQLKSAASTEEFQAAQESLNAVKTRLRAIKREAALTGAGSITSAKTFEQAFLRISNGAITGRQSVMAMVKSLGLLAKTQIGLMVFTTVWTLFEDQISGFLDKWKELDPTTEANKKKMEEMAEAVREAGRAAIEAGHALAEQFHSDEAARQADIAIRKFQHEKEALENNVTALQKLSKARQADMELAATIAGDEAALKKLQIENDYINGKISATEKAIALKRIEADAATAADQLKLEQAREELQLRRQLNEEAGKAQAAANRKVVDVRAKGANLMSEKEIAAYEKTRASIEVELMELAESDRTASTAQRVTNDERRRYLQRELDRINARRDESGRNTAAEYEAWQRELDAAEQAAASLTTRYNELNSQMYEQQAAVSALEKSNARRAEARKNLAAAEEKNLRDEEKQNKRDEANKKRVDALKDKVDHMELSELKARQARIQRQISNETNDRKRGRLENYAKVYNDEIERRLDRAQKEAGKALHGNYASGKKEGAVMERAAALLEKIAANETYTRADFNAAKELMKAASRTTGTADDSVVYELIDYMNATATAINRQHRQNAKLGNEVARLKAKLVKPDR